MSRLPSIGVTDRSRRIGLHACRITGDKYVRAVAIAAKGLPSILSSQAKQLDPTDIIDGLDGILFTGSPSTVEPFHYSGPASAPGTAHDPAHDATTLPLIRAGKQAIQRDADASNNA